VHDLTVVTVVLNDVAGLRRTLDSMRSVLSAGELVQHVIIDGGSVDGTGDVAREYADSEFAESVVVVSERDAGLYDAMNKGLALANGRYVLFLNADDEISGPEVFSIVLERLRTVQPVWLISRTAFLNEVRDIVGISENMPFSRWRHLLGLQMHAHPSTIVRRDVLVELGGFNYDLADFAADWDVVVQVARKAPKPVEVDDVLSLFAAGGLSERRIADTHKVLGRIRDVRLGGRPGIRLLNGLWTGLLDWRLHQKLTAGSI